MTQGPLPPLDLTFPSKASTFPSLTPIGIRKEDCFDLHAIFFVVFLVVCFFLRWFVLWGGFFFVGFFGCFGFLPTALEGKGEGRFPMVFLLYFRYSSG